MIHDQLGGALGVLEREEGDDPALALWEEPAGEGDSPALELCGELGAGVGARREGLSLGMELPGETQHGMCGQISVAGIVPVFSGKARLELAPRSTQNTAIIRDIIGCPYKG